MAFDVDYNLISTLLHGEGTNGGVVFTDNGPLPKTFAVESGTPTTSTTKSKFGASSIHLNGSSSLSITHADFAVGTGDFTVELFINPNAFNTRTIICFGSGGGNSADGLNITLSSAGAIGLLVGSSTKISGGVCVVGTWAHVALRRDAGVYQLYKDGVLLGQYASANNISSGIFVLGGWYAYASENVHAYIDELRITKGLARSITVPTEAYPDGNGIVSMGAATLPALSAMSFSGATAAASLSALSASASCLSD